MFDGGKQGLRGDVLLRQNIGIALFFEKIRIEQLIPAAGSRGQGHQHAGALGGQQFKQGIGAAASDKQIGSGKHQRHLAGKIFVYAIVRMGQAGIHIAFAGDMDEVVALGKRGKGLFERGV